MESAPFPPPEPEMVKTEAEARRLLVDAVEQEVVVERLKRDLLKAEDAATQARIACLNRIPLGIYSVRAYNDGEWTTHVVHLGEGRVYKSQQLDELSAKLPDSDA